MALSFLVGSSSGSGNSRSIARSSSFFRRNDDAIFGEWRFLGRVDDAVAIVVGGGFIGDQRFNFVGGGIDILLKLVDMWRKILDTVTEIRYTLFRWTQLT